MLHASLPLVALGFGALARSTAAAYTLQDSYAPQSFFSMFSFWDQADPTNGYVDYVNQGEAQSDGLIQTNSNNVYFGVDHNNTASGSGRKSVRLTSQKSYDSGLFILDASHMPQGCGTWPAFWLVGPNWPNDGEIDIIEGVNSATTNQATLHTSSGCSISNSGGMSGNIVNPSCAVGGGSNQGCGIADSATNSYGAGFNAIQGGVYATEVTANTISVWFFPRGSIPGDLNGNSPDPSGWGTPFAHFSGCDISSHFKDLQIVFDTTFCGDWAGAVWSSDSTCSAKASTCQAYVQNNPGAFADAYWTVNSLRVFSANGGGAGKAVEHVSSTAVSSAVSSTVAPSSTFVSSSMLAPSSTLVSAQATSSSAVSSSGASSSAVFVSSTAGSSSPATTRTASSPASPSGASSAPSSSGTGSYTGPWEPIVLPGSNVVSEEPVDANSPSNSTTSGGTGTSNMGNPGSGSSSGPSAASAPSAASSGSASSPSGASPSASPPSGTAGSNGARPATSSGASAQPTHGPYAMVTEEGSNIVTEEPVDTSAQGKGNADSGNSGSANSGATNKQRRRAHVREHAVVRSRHL